MPRYWSLVCVHSCQASPNLIPHLGAPFLGCLHEKRAQPKGEGNEQAAVAGPPSASWLPRQPFVLDPNWICDLLHPLTYDFICSRPLCSVSGLAAVPHFACSSSGAAQAIRTRSVWRHCTSAGNKAGAAALQTVQLCRRRRQCCRHRQQQRSSSGWPGPDLRGWRRRDWTDGRPAHQAVAAWGGCHAGGRAV